jgi:transcriptional regulator with XRE-family HTH domain
MKAIQDIDQIPALIHRARKAQNMTQQQLADKSGVPKYRIREAENNVGDLPIIILRTIIEKGLGGLFNMAFEF